MWHFVKNMLNKLSFRIKGNSTQIRFNFWSGLTTDIDRDTRTCTILILVWGWIWGSSGSPRIKIIVVCQVRVTCMYRGLSIKTNKRKNAARREDREHICFAFISACVVSKNPKPTKLSPIADDAITWSGIRGLVPLVYICGLNSIVHGS